MCPVGDEDRGEKERRETLRRFVSPSDRLETTADQPTALSIYSKLAGIITKLEPLSEQHGIMKFLKNVDHASILSGFVQDLAYAVTDYQVWEADSITGAV